MLHSPPPPLQGPNLLHTILSTLFHPLIHINEDPRGPNCKGKFFHAKSYGGCGFARIIVIRPINLHSTEPKTNEITISKMLPIELRRKRT